MQRLLLVLLDQENYKRMLRGQGENDNKATGKGAYVPIETPVCIALNCNPWALQYVSRVSRVWLQSHFATYQSRFTAVALQPVNFRM